MLTGPQPNLLIVELTTKKQHWLVEDEESPRIVTVGTPTVKLDLIHSDLAKFKVDREMKTLEFECTNVTFRGVKTTVFIQVSLPDFKIAHIAAI